MVPCAGSVELEITSKNEIIRIIRKEFYEMCSSPFAAWEGPIYRCLNVLLVELLGRYVRVS